MAVVAQRNGVRVVAFQKCGNTSIINMFLTPAGEPLVRGRAPAIRNSGDPVTAETALRGPIEATQSWPEPELTLAFFRNPLMRALSAYEHFIVRTLHYPEESNGGPVTLGRQSFTDMGFTPDMSFEDFCLHLRNIDLSADKHLKSQAISYMQGASQPPQVYAGQLEQLDITWPLIVKQYGLDCTTEVAHYNEAKYITENRLSGARLDLFEQLYATDYRYWKAAYFEAGAPISSECH